MQTSSSSPTSQPSWYFFKTKNGTTIDTFEQYIKTMPDEGQGEKLTDPIVPFQSYMTTLTAPQAEEVAKQSFVRYIDPVVPFETDFPGGDWGLEEQHHHIATTTSPSTNPTSTMPDTQASLPSSELAPTWYYFKTKNGTTIDTFEEYVKTLPDKGQGEKFTDPIMPYQSYMTQLTSSQA